MSRTIDANTWMTLNNIIYKIYATESETDMRQSLLDQLHMLINFDSADFYLAEEGHGGELVAPVLYNCDVDNAREYELEDEDRGILSGGRSLVYRETDIISEEKRPQTSYYRHVFLPNNWHYSLQMVLGHDKKLLGVVNLYRMIGKEDFQYEDIFMLDMIKEHLALRLEQEAQQKRGDKLTVQETAQEYELTKRETMILQCLMQGLCNDSISDQLDISVNTIKKHILNIYRKLGIRNRVQLFKMVREFG